MQLLLIATTNKGKLVEIRELMADLPYEVISLTDALERGLLSEMPNVIEDGETFEYNAMKKATEIMELSGVVTLSDDSGLVIDYLDGQPGVHSAYFMGADTPYEIRNVRLIEMLADAPEDARTARFVCVAAIAYPDGRTDSARGEVEGVIAHAPAGTNGFGYDPIFLVPQFGRTLAELSVAEKNSISHRAVAMKKAKELLS